VLKTSVNSQNLKHLIFYVLIKLMDTLRNHKLQESISFALRGIWQAIKNERNIKIELGFAFWAIVAGFAFGITKTEWLAIIIIVFAILSAEILNSSIESLCNLVRDEENLGYKKTKLTRDIAAGAVMLLAIGSVVLGLVIFLPYIFAALSNVLVL